MADGTRLGIGAGMMILASLLAACDAGISGKFKDDSGMLGLDFQRNGKVVMLEMGRQPKTRDYVVKGETVRINMGDGNMEFRMDQDRLVGALGITLQRAK